MSWIKQLFSRRRRYDELSESIRQHLDEKIADLMDRGLTREQAEQAARREFGNVSRIEERSREIWQWPTVESVLADLRFTLRQLRRAPGFAATAIVVLALGMGVSVAIFGFVDAALLEPLPYAQPNRLMAVSERNYEVPWANVSYYDYRDWTQQNKSFSSLDVYGESGFLLRTASGTVPVDTGRVSAGFFRTLGVRPMLGRVFLPGEDRPGEAKVAVLNYGTWLKQFGGRRDVVGQTVDLNGDVYTIVGVLPRSFVFAPEGSAELWVPIQELNGCETRRGCHSLNGLGRLRDGVTMQQALADLQGIQARLALEYPDSDRGREAVAKPLSELIVGDVRPILLTLLGGAGLLLLIACVNVASLLLVRAESRKREVAVRGALGAAPARLVRQFITEGLLLAAAGCAGGVLVAAGLMRLLTGLIPKAMAEGLPFLKLVGVNAHTALFAGGIALLAAAVLALTPILRLTFQDIREGLADGDRGAAGRTWRRFGANLVVVELAVAVVLLAGAGLLGRSFYKLLHVELGFDPSRLATVQVMVPESMDGNLAGEVALYREIERRVSALPGVQSVGMVANNLPVQCNCNTDGIRAVDRPYNGEHAEVNERDVSANYMATLKARLVRGRMLTADDDQGKPRVALINEELARKFFPGEDPIGQKIGDWQLTPNSIREVVGVIADVRDGALDDPLWPSEYLPLNQNPSMYFAVVVRTAQDAGAFLPTLVETIHSINPNLGTTDENTMDGRIAETQTALMHRFSSWLVGGFAAMALVLGVVGLYGVIAYSVSQRTREIGVRIALGAQRGTVYRMVLRQAGWLTASGLVIGLAGSVGTSMLMRKMLFGVTEWDAATLTAVAAMLGTAAMAASFVPARRAASVDPVQALRSE